MHRQEQGPPVTTSTSVHYSQPTTPFAELEPVMIRSQFPWRKTKNNTAIESFHSIHKLAMVL
jgi:hypothetical protein